MKITVLGNGSASPTLDRNPSSLVLEYRNKLYLLDCGEATQYRFLEHNISFTKLSYILISHLHGDHFLGLFGLLSTLNTWGREKELTLVGPVGLKDILVTQFKYQQTILNYAIRFIETQSVEKQQVIETKDVTIFTFPLQHRIETTGFLFVEKTQDYKLKKDKLPVNIKLEHIHQLKSGNDVYENDKILYKNSDYANEPDSPKQFAYCTDTVFDPSILAYFNKVDLLYHEATFLDEHAARAASTFHSTAKQAATIALQSDCKQLLIGHFSARYTEINSFKTEAETVFSNTVLATSGLVIEI